MFERKLSTVGTVDTGGVHCPKCGSTSFKPHRSIKGKVAGGLLAPKSKLRCLICKKEFRRG